MEPATRFNVEALFSSATLVWLRISVWTAKKDLPKGGDKRRGKHVFLVDKKWLKGITRVERAARDFLQEKGGRSPTGSGYLIDNEILPEVMQRLEDFQEEFLDAVDDFVEEEFDSALVESREELTAEELELMPAKTALPRKFGFRYGRIIFALPSMGAAETQASIDNMEEWATNNTNGLLLRGYERLRHAESIFGNTKRRLYASVIGQVLAWCEEYATKRSILWGIPPGLLSIVNDTDQKFRGLNLAALRKDEGKRLDASQLVKSLADRLEPLLPSGDDVALEEER